MSSNSCRHGRGGVFVHLSNTFAFYFRIGFSTWPRLDSAIGRSKASRPAIRQAWDTAHSALDDLLTCANANPFLHRPDFHISHKIRKHPHHRRHRQHDGHARNQFFHGSAHPLFSSTRSCLRVCAHTGKSVETSTSSPYAEPYFADELSGGAFGPYSLRCTRMQRSL